MALKVAPDTEAGPRNGDAPSLSNGTELLGPYEGSGFTAPQYLLRRQDGQVIRISQLLYLVTAQMDGRQDLDTIAHRVSEQMGRPVTASNVAHLVDTKLAQLGIVDGQSVAESTTTDPLLGLRLRTGLVPERLHRGITTALRPVFAPTVVVAVLVALAGVDTWLIADRRGAVVDGWIEILTRPGLFLTVTGVTLFAMAFHEFGHATACRYGGARPGAMGVGVYIVWPAFFTDVSDAYRLDRRGRLRTDLGGIYFNAIFALAAGGAYTLTGFAPLVVMSVLMQVQALYQLVPFVRLDGYYILGDLIGVPNPFVYVRATFLTLFAPRRSAAHSRARSSLGAIRRSARITLIVWVLVLIPVLLAAVGLSFYLLPRTVPVVMATLRLDADVVSNGVAHGEWMSATNGALQFLFLTLPLVGWLSTLWYFVKHLMTTRWARILRNPRAWRGRFTLVVAALAVIGAIALTLQLRASNPSAAQTRPSGEAAAEIFAPADLEPPATAPAPAPSEVAAPPVAPAPPSVPPAAPAVEAPTRWSLLMSLDHINGIADDVPHHDIAIGTWHVEPGDDFWHMAETILTDAYRRAPTASEHGAYWAQLVEANRDRLVRPGDANVIFPGQDFNVVLPALTPSHTTLFGNGSLGDHATPP